jgi:hypothetical protein
MLSSGYAILWVCCLSDNDTLEQTTALENVQFGLVHFGSAISHRIFSASSSDYTSSDIDSKSDTVTWISLLVGSVRGKIEV